VKVAIGGVQLAYEERGSGFPFVLVHGFPFSRAMWERQLGGLANTARIIAPDLRGFGESEGTPTTIEGLADDRLACSMRWHSLRWPSAGFRWAGMSCCGTLRATLTESRESSWSALARMLMRRMCAQIDSPRSNGFRKKV